MKKVYVYLFFSSCEEIFVHISLVVSNLFLLITKNKHLRILQNYLSHVPFPSTLFSLYCLSFIFDFIVFGLLLIQ